MTFARKSGGSNVALTTVKRRSGGAWTNVQTVKRRSGGAWVTVWSAYTPISDVTASPSSINRTTFGSTTPAVATAPLPTLSWSGGNPSPTQTWTVISGALVINSSQVRTNSTIAYGATVTGTIRGTVNDGTSSGYVDVPVSLSYAKTV